MKNPKVYICMFTVVAALLVVLPPRISLASTFSKERFLGDAKAPWQITAKSMSYNEEQGVYVAEGDVVIKKQGRFLYAQKAVYNEKTGIAEVSGDVWLETESDILVGEEGVFNLNRQTGKMKKACLFLKENNYYVSGEVMEKTGKDTYLVKNCRLTTCETKIPAWSINGSEVKVTIEGHGTAKNAVFRVHGMPVLYVPYMIFPAKTKRQTGLLPPRMGHSDRTGVDLELPFFWAISDQTDATFYQRYMSERGYMQGIEFRYLVDENSKGIFLFDVLLDREDEKDMSDSDDQELSPFARTNRTRYWLRGMMDQALPFRVFARLDVDFVSDQDYLREFEKDLFGIDARTSLARELGRPVEEKRSPTRRTALRLSRDSDNYSLQAIASYHQRPEHISDDDTPEPIGSLGFVWLPEQLRKLPLFYGLESDYGYVWRDEGDKGHRFSLSPEMRFPFWFGRYIEFEPSLRYTYTTLWFDGGSGDNDHQSKKAYEVNARLSAKIERVYDCKWGDAKRLKHRMWPELSYRYRNHLDEEEEDDNPWFEPIDDEEDVNLFTFSLRNYLDARLEDAKGKVRYRQWASWTLSQGFDVHEARRDEGPGEDREPFTPLTFAFTATPFTDIDIRGDMQWNHYDTEFSSANLSADLSVDRSGGRQDRYTIDYVYRKDSKKSIDCWSDVNLVHGFSVGASLERDMELDEDISNSFWIRYVSQCWGITVKADREDEETSIGLGFQLMGLGDTNTPKR